MSGWSSLHGSYEVEVIGLGEASHEPSHTHPNSANQELILLQTTVFHGVFVF